MTSKFTPAAVLVLVLMVAALVWQALNSEKKNEPIPNSADQSEAVGPPSLAPPHTRHVEPERDFVLLAQQNVDLGREIAMKSVKHESADMRIRSAEALGYFTDKESHNALKVFIADPDSRVRLQALRSLAYRENEERSAILREFLNAKKHPDRETVAALGSLVRVSSDAQLKLKASNRLLLLVESYRGESRELALREAIAVASDHELLLKLLRGEIENSNSERSIEMAIIHLASQKDSWIKGQLKKLSGSQILRIQLAVLNALHLACPNDRWSILKSLLHEKSDPEIIRAVIEEADALGGPEGRQFLEGVLLGVASVEPFKSETLKKLRNWNDSRPRPCGLN